MTTRPIIAIARLRELRAALDAGRPVSADVVAWFTAAIAEYDAGAPEGLTLDKALGLVPAPGNDSWWTAEARKRRNRALRTLRQRHYAEIEPSEAAIEIGKLERRYRGVVWREPENLQVDERRLLLREALETGVKFPGKRQLAEILGNESSVFISKPALHHGDNDVKQDRGLAPVVTYLSRR
jgi:hypothetical protein